MADEGSGVDALTERLTQGDSSALVALFELNRSRLKRMVSIRLDRRLSGRVDENDVLQESYLTLSRKIDSYDPKLTPYIWMRLTVLERLIDLHRKHIKAEKRDARREVSLSQKVNDDSSAEIAGTLADSFSSVGGRVARAEVSELIKLTLESMEEKDREVIILRIFESMSNAEAAQVLGLSPNGASSRFSRAMERLQKEVMQAQKQLGDDSSF